VIALRHCRLVAGGGGARGRGGARGGTLEARRGRRARDCAEHVVRRGALAVAARVEQRRQARRAAARAAAGAAAVAA